MASEDWIECKLADACSSIDYGLTASAADGPVGPRFLRITDIVGGAVDWNAVPYVIANEETTAKYRLHEGDIVLARTGASTGASAYIKSPPPAVFASYLVRLKAKTNFDSRFLAYYLRSEPFWVFLRGVLGDKSAQPNASASTMTKAPLRAPRSKETQRAIAHILGSLDDKIELNRRMNETLEALARAIFDDMFGREVPNAAVGDLAEIERDSVSPMEHEDELFDHYSLPAFDEGRCPARERGGNIKSNKFSVRPRAVLVSKLNPSIPRVWFPRIGSERRSVASTEFQVMRANETCTPEFLYCLLLSEPVREHLVGLASGTSNSHQRVKPEDLLGTPAPRPDPEALERFTSTTRPMFGRVRAALEESSTLAALRDTLLPKLLSGELRIPDTEKTVEAAL